MSYLNLNSFSSQNSMPDLVEAPGGLNSAEQHQVQFYVQYPGETTRDNTQLTAYEQIFYGYQIRFNTSEPHFGCLTGWCSICSPMRSSILEREQLFVQTENYESLQYLCEGICFCRMRETPFGYRRIAPYCLTCSEADTYETASEDNFSTNFSIDYSDYDDDEDRNVYHTPTLTPILYSEVLSSSCAICMDSNHGTLVKLSCSHIFHETCVLQWLLQRSQCPMCRGEPQMFAGVRRTVNAIVNAADTVQNLNNTVENIVSNVREYGNSINRATETFELLMHLMSLVNNSETGFCSSVQQVWHALHIVASFGKIIFSSSIPFITNIFEDMEDVQFTLDMGDAEFDFGTLFATSVAAYNFLPPGLRASLDFMTRHSRTRFLTDSTIFSSVYHFILSSPRIVLTHIIDAIPQRFPFRRTATGMLRRLLDGFDIVYAFLPGTIEYTMTERASTLIQRYASQALIIKQQAFLDEFNSVFEFFSSTYLRVATHTDVPANIKFICESLKAVKRVITSQERSTRVEPVWFHLYGGTGRGKSSLMAALIDMFSMSSYVHQRKPDQKEFFDGYNNEEIFVEDDLTSEDQFHKYLSFVSPIAQPLECCDSGMKGIKKFTSNIIMTTSNYLAPELYNQKKVETGKALHRRYYAVHFSDVIFDGVQFRVAPDSQDQQPTIRIFKQNPTTGLEGLEYTGNANDLVGLANFMCDRYDANYNLHAARPQRAAFVRQLLGAPQISFQDIVNASQQAIDFVANLQPVQWTSQHITAFIQRYLYNVQGVYNNNNCVICMNVLGNHQTTLMCGHTFCTNCITLWMQVRAQNHNQIVCPICRAPAVVRGANGNIMDFIRVQWMRLSNAYDNFSFQHPILHAILQGVLAGTITGLIVSIITLVLEKMIVAIDKRLVATGKITPPVSSVVETNAGVQRLHLTLAGEAQVYPDRVSQTFPSELERVRNNMLFARFVFDNGNSGCGIITFVDGLSFICPAHFLLLEGKLHSICTVYAEDQEGAQLISGQRFVVKYIDITSDIAVMTFQVSNQPRLFRNISSIFSGDLVNHDLFLITPDQVLPVPHPTRLKMDVGYFTFAGATISAKVAMSCSYVYQANGLCGALLVTRDGKIIGMHALKNSCTGLGVARYFSKQTRTELNKCTEVGEQRKLSPVSAFVIEQPNLYRHVPYHSTIVKSDLHGVFPVERAPAILKGKNTLGENILSKAVVKNIKPVQACDELAMQYVEYALDRFLGSYKSKELSTIEVIHGNGKIPRLEPKSASGIPYSGKNSDNIDYTTSTFSKEINDNISKMKSEFEKGEFSIHTIIFGDTLKDELRDLEKVTKPRLFAAGPIHFTTELKRYLADLIYHFCDDRLNNGIMIGINALGREWDLLAKKLQSKGKNIIPGDFENWDGGMLARYQELANKHLSNRTTNPKYVLWLLTHLVRTSRAVLDEMIVTTHSVPSGHALTAFYNSLLNFMYQCYAFFVLCPFKDKSFSYIYDQQVKNIFSAKYGDDVAMNVSDSTLKYFNAISFAQVMKSLGIGFTTEDKKEHTVPSVSLSECTFLKRSFIFHTKLQRIVGPLSLKTLQSSISFVTDAFRMEELVDEKVLNFQREIYLHEFLYQPLMDILTNKYFEVYQTPPNLLSQSDIYRLYERDEVECTYGLVGRPQMLKCFQRSNSVNTNVTVGIHLVVVDSDGVEFILLVKGYDYVQSDGSITRGKWGLPKGRLHEGERICEGALRELREETGIHMSRWDLHERKDFGSSNNHIVFKCLISLDQLLKKRISANNEIAHFKLVRNIGEVETNLFTRQYFQ